MKQYEAEEELANARIDASRRELFCPIIKKTCVGAVCICWSTGAVETLVTPKGKNVFGYTLPGCTNPQLGK